MTIRPVVMDLMSADDPVRLLDRTLLRSGGTVSVCAPDGRDILYFQPTGDRLAQFHVAERLGTLQNHNTPAAAELFDGTVFNLTGDRHRDRRRTLIRSFGHRGPWRDHVDTAVDAWIATADGRHVVDLLDETRRLAHAIFARVVFGIGPASSEGQAVSLLSRQFVAGAIAAATPEPDRDVLAQARAARNELGSLFTTLRGLGSGRHNFPLDARDLGAVLIASIETTANLLGWAVVRWLRHDPSGRRNVDAFAHRVEKLDSPNTLITREAVSACRFVEVDLAPGTLVSYSPASAVGDDVAFGSGPRACPGRAIAQYTVRRVLAALTTSPWSLAVDEMPVPQAWLPVRTFGTGTLVQTTREATQCR